MVFVLSYYLIIFYFVRYGCYLLEALSKHFSIERQKGEVDPEGGEVKKN